MSKAGDDKDLMAYLDGELGARDARGVEERLAGSPEAKLKVGALEQLGGVMRAHYQARTDEAGPRLDALWSAISVELEGQLGAPEKAPVAERADRRARAAPAELGWWAALKEWFGEGYRGHVLTGAVCAAAAGLLVYVAVQKARPEPQIIERIVEREVPVLMQPEAVSAAAEIESLEVSGGTGTVFQIAGDKAGEPATTVIWVVRDESGPGDPI